MLRRSVCWNERYDSKDHPDIFGSCLCCELVSKPNLLSFPTNLNFSDVKVKWLLAYFLPATKIHPNHGLCFLLLSISCLFLERKDSGVFTWLMQRLTSLCSKRKQASRWEGDKERAQFTGYWSSPSDLFSILLLRLEYHPRDPLTGISDSVDTLVRAAPPTCHQSSSQHTIKMTSAAGGRRIASLRKTPSVLLWSCSTHIESERLMQSLTDWRRSAASLTLLAGSSVELCHFPSTRWVSTTAGRRLLLLPYRLLRRYWT